MNLIFILPYSPTAWDAERFGFNFFIEKGINLIVFDMSKLICTRSGNTSKFLQQSYIKKIFTYTQLEQEVQTTAQTAIYIDKINGLNGFKWESRKIFKIFKKYAVKYYLVEIGTLPLLPSYNTKNILNKFKKALNLKKLYAYCKWKLGKSIVNFQAKYFNSYQLPQKIFVGNTDLLSYYLQQYRLERSNVVPIHSFDYDRYIQYLRSNKSSDKTEKICVFLDQALAYHSDFGTSVSYSPVTAEIYISSMNRFFAKIERETQLEVVIAASPRANSDEMKKMFANRKIIKGKTLELVAQCSLVLMHSSTAVSFAILFNKPILLLKTNEMCFAHGYSNFIDNMATSLCLKPIYIDQQDKMNKLDLSQYHQIEKNYMHYKYKYIMTEGLADKTTSEILVEHLQKFY